MEGYAYEGEITGMLTGLGITPDDVSAQGENPCPAASARGISLAKAAFAKARRRC